MSLVQKIPPMVSALAFGYGVGMAAPESTIASVRSAVAVVQEDRARPPRAPVQLAEQEFPRRPSLRGASGAMDESRELARLRKAAAREARGGEACDLDRPSFSRAPRYESKADREVEDVDDLDVASADALSRLQMPDLRIAVTRRTLKYVRFFTRNDRGRATFETWLKRSGRYQEMIQAELRDERLPEDLLWVAMIESGFDPRAKSQAGAAGLWQFMPATGAVYGLSQSRYVDQRKNPRLATLAAARHLGDLYARFGAWDLALAAYNMGYEQLLNAIDRYGTADFNELARQEAIPAETAAYVPKIGAAAIVANNLERFGFDKVEQSRPLDAAELPVPPGTELKMVARAAGVATATIRALNPDILAERLPPGRGDFLLLIPADTVSRARAALPLLLDNEPLYTDDVSALDRVDLFTGRELSRRRAQREDESLLSLLPSYRRKGVLAEELPAPLAGREDAPAAPEPGSERLLDGERDDDPLRRSLAHRGKRRRETVIYRVAPGDTAVGVARQFAMDVDDLARQNRLGAGAELKVGSLLKLRVRRDLLEDLGGAVAREDDKDPKGRDHGDKGQDGKDAKDKPRGTPPPASHEDRPRKARRDPT